jgi:hypothetical protein
MVLCLVRAERLASQPGSFTPLRNSLRYLLDRGPGSPQRWSGCCEEKNILIFPDNENR